MIRGRHFIWAVCLFQLPWFPLSSHSSQVTRRCVPLQCRLITFSAGGLKFSDFFSVFKQCHPLSLCFQIADNQNYPSSMHIQKRSKQLFMQKNLSKKIKNKNNQMLAFWNPQMKQNYCPTNRNGQAPTVVLCTQLSISSVSFILLSKVTDRRITRNLSKSSKQNYRKQYKRSIPLRNILLYSC